MKLSNKKIKYIKRQSSRKTPEQIAKDLKITNKDVQKILQQLEGNFQGKRISTLEKRRGGNPAYKHHLLFILTISLFCVIIYSNTLSSPFILDDFHNIVDNYYLRIDSLDFQQLINAAFKSASKNRPVANISFALNYYLGKYDALGYHIVNITIHLINGILVYFLSLIMFKQINDNVNQRTIKFNSISIPLMSLFAALIFVTHPIQTQSVTYIVQRMTSMAAMFYLLSLLLYIHARMVFGTRKQWILFSGCFISWMMALGTKEIAASLPLIILLYEWFFFQNLRAQWLRQNKKFFLGLFAILILVMFIYTGNNPIDKILGGYSNRDFTLTERILTQMRVVVFYVSLLFYPHPSRLNLHHHVITSSSIIEPITTLSSMAFLLGLFVLAVYLARRQRLLSFCILWFLLNLAIESSIIPLEVIFEHRLYLPVFGFSLLVAYLLFDVVSMRRLWIILISAIVILFMSTATYVRNTVWSDEITLLKDCVKKSPQLARPHNNLGKALAKEGRTEEAIDHYSKALRIKPNHVNALTNLGVALNKQGRTEEAIDHYSKALRIKPDHEGAHYNLANALANQGHISEAIDHYSKAIQIRHDYGEAHNNLGVALARAGDFERAITHFRIALQINPDHTQAKNNLKRAMMKK